MNSILRKKGGTRLAVSIDKHICGEISGANDQTYRARSSQSKIRRWMLMSCDSIENSFAPKSSAQTQSAEREALIAAHIAQVRRIAERIAAKLPPDVEREDIYGAGVIGLLDAVERFDVRRNVSFAAFAETRVRGAILDSLRQTCWASRGACRRTREVRRARAQIERETGRAATETEIARRLRISVAAVRRIAVEADNLRFVELDAEAPENSQNNLRDTIFDRTASPLEQYEIGERRARLAAAVELLPARERAVVALYYVEELTLKEIGATLGVTEARASQLRAQAVRKLRQRLIAQN